MKTALIVGLMFVLSACSTGVNYKPEAGKSLVVGRIIYTGKGLENPIYHLNMNGIVKKGIEITIKKPNSKKVTIKSGEEGLFYYHAPANTNMIFPRKNGRFKFHAAILSNSAGGK